MTPPSRSDLPKTLFKSLIDDPSTPAPLHPGEVLREDLMPHFGLSAADLARMLDASMAVVQGLLDERTRVTPDLAIRLGAAFAQSPGYWRALQLQYDIWSDADGRHDASRDTLASKRDRRPAA
ncbi:MAG: HigA family addiction module antitoxin [Hyphomicrobium sp.]